MLTADYDYALPPELIAQTPLPQRSQSRMLVLNRATGEIQHRHITDLPHYLTPKDLIVLNNTKVYPARLQGTWTDTHGAVELLLVEEEAVPGRWHCLGGSGRKMRPGLTATFADGAITAQILSRDGENCTVQLSTTQPLPQLLARHGQIPLPPYIQRLHPDPADQARYQTLYAEHVGAVAAPTAGLHFDEPLFEALRARQIAWDYITLHVGPGTFKPVKTQHIEEHTLDPERYQVTPQLAQKLLDTRANNGRILAVGSTTVRTLETLGLGNHGTGKSALFIHPPYTFRSVDLMLTNFHLPQSTLLMMVSALAGRDNILRAYQEAIQHRYRFYSYGDCMLIQ